MLKTTRHVRVLASILHNIAKGRYKFEPDDLYKMCALMRGADGDVLQLKQSTGVMDNLRSQYAQYDAASLSPFQKSLMESMLLPSSTGTGATQAADSSALASSPPSSAADLDQQKAVAAQALVNERVRFIWEMVNQAHEQQRMSPDTARVIEENMSHIEKDVRSLSPHSCASLVKALASANYQNYSHVALLSRRSCEVASKLNRRQCMKLYFNLHKLNTKDSLVAIVNQFYDKPDEWDAEDVLIVALSLERQSNASHASSRLLPAIAKAGPANLQNAKNPSYHRALLMTLARYNYAQHPAMVAVLRDLVDNRRLDKLHDRDILPILSLLCDLSSKTFTFAVPKLLNRLTTLIPSMSMGDVVACIDMLSLVPVDTTPAMNAVMARLAESAGQLPPPQVAATLDLLAGYPPARGSPCVVSLAFAAALRAEMYDHTLLETIVCALCDMQFFTDDFFTIWETLMQKGGPRKVESVMQLLNNLTPAEAATDRGQSVVREAVLSLSPGLSPKQQHECRQQVTRLCIRDPEVLQRLSSSSARTRNSQNKSKWGSRQFGHDPVDDMML